MGESDEPSMPRLLLCWGVLPILMLLVVEPVFWPETQQHAWPGNLRQWIALINLAVCAPLALVIYVSEQVQRRAWDRYEQDSYR